MAKPAPLSRAKRVRILTYKGFNPNRQTTFSIAALVCCVASCLCPGGAAFAELNSAAVDETEPLQEIVVTARKRTEDVQKIPETVLSLDSKLLEDSHLTRIDDLQNYVSNLVIITRGDNTPDVVMRGVGSLGVVNGVGFFANDVQLFDGQTVRPEDLERIEVLKGPQGTLYGGSNIGGAIKYITKLPTDTFEATAALEGGNYNTWTTSSAVSGPIVPGVLTARVSVFDTWTDGYIFDTTLNKKVSGGAEYGDRLTLMYRGDATTATLYVDGNQNSTGIGANLYYRPTSLNDYSLNMTAGTRPSYERQVTSATLNVAHDFEDKVTITSISSAFYSTFHDTLDIDKGPLPFVTGVGGGRRVVWSEELRLASGDAGPLHWMSGIFAQGNDPATSGNTIVFTGDPSNDAALADPSQYFHQPDSIRQRHHEYAAFANATYDWERWSIEAGIRADYNNSDMADPVNNLRMSQHGSEVLPKLSVSYHVSDGSMLYTTVSKGYEPGDVAEQFDVNGNPYLQNYRPETAWTLEGGVKSRLNDRVTLNAAVFYTKYNDRLFQTYKLEANQFIQVTQNLGDSRIYGVEGEIFTHLGMGFSIKAGFGLTKSTWGNIPYYDPDTQVVISLKDKTPPNTPVQGSITANWDHPVGDRWKFDAFFNAAFTGAQFWDLTENNKEPAYQLLSLGMRLEDDAWSFSTNVSNLTNTLYHTAYATSAEIGAPWGVAGIGPPRLWTARVAYKFH